MLLQKIKAIAAINKEIIERLQAKKGNFVSGYNYEVEVETKSTPFSLQGQPINYGYGHSCSYGSNYVHVDSMSYTYRLITHSRKSNDDSQTIYGNADKPS
jgi:hypothetical protein